MSLRVSTRLTTDKGDFDIECDTVEELLRAIRVLEAREPLVKKEEGVRSPEPERHTGWNALPLPDGGYYTCFGFSRPDVVKKGVVPQATVFVPHVDGTVHVYADGTVAFHPHKGALADD